MKKVLVFIITIIMFTFTLNNVYAHPGRTDSNGCHTCRTNCAKWGLSQGEYHCHNSKATTSSTSKTTSKTVKTPKKSSDTKIKSITIDGKTQKITNNMKYETTNETLEIKATPNSKYADIDIGSPYILKHGKNKITITVTAQDNTTKDYNLTVVYKSEDTDIKRVKIDETTYYSGEIESINYKTTKDVANLEVTPNSEYATAHYNKKVNLSEGTNNIKLKIIAENGKEKEYQIKITKEQSDDLDTIIGLLFLAGIGLTIYFVIKNKKKPKNIKYCIKCGKEINQENKYCPHCGSSQE